ncbi:hypothetical protein GCM10007989_14520 [Devosia pacifica]|uniref:Transglycosylase SLT domain-containing protein n=1 Tax=Devosia pacifica TaxID=1335967 RepID=A0A918S4W6_9HYPH|nr:hypothetical protein GCM10007989_14520 [Devosia pacifica]
MRVNRLGFGILMVSGSILLCGCSIGAITPKASTAVAALTAKPSAAVPESSSVPLASAVSAYADSSSGGLDGLIRHYSDHYEVPESLVRRVIVRESNYNPKARNGAHWGLMQIRHDTAVSMGYRGEASGLLDAETNLRYAVKYLAGAYMVAQGNQDRAVRFYASGYYYDAKRMGLLEATGLR